MQVQDRVDAFACALAARTSEPVPVLDASRQDWPPGAETAVAHTRGDVDDAQRQLADSQAFVDLLGRTGAGSGTTLAVLRREQPFATPVPDEFRVLAVLPAYNEADIIVGTVQDLLDQGIDVHVLDNWSTDGTPERLEGVTGRGRLVVERFPAADAPVRYEWEAILRRIAQVAHASGAHWCVLHDVDERRRGPWPGRNLRESLHEVECRGFNAVDHTVWEYHPVDNAFTGPGDDLEQTMRHWSPPQVGANRTQIKAWRSPGVEVDLAASGGHEVAFEGRRVFPYNFLLKHYPIRSQSHGERKVLVDRKPRFSASERRRLWHRHYDHIRAGHDFLWSPEDLREDTADSFGALLVERVTGSDPEVGPEPPAMRQAAARALAASGLRPAFVAARRSVRIARRRNAETGRR